MSHPKCFVEFTENNNLTRVLKTIRHYARQVDKRKKPFNQIALRDTGRFYADLLVLPF